MPLGSCVLIAAKLFSDPKLRDVVRHTRNPKKRLIAVHSLTRVGIRHAPNVVEHLKPNSVLSRCATFASPMTLKPTIP